MHPKKDAGNYCKISLTNTAHVMMLDAILEPVALIFRTPECPFGDLVFRASTEVPREAMLTSPEAPLRRVYVFC